MEGFWRYSALQICVLHYITSEPSAGSLRSFEIREFQLLLHVLSPLLLLMLLMLQLLMQVSDARLVLRLRAPVVLSPTTDDQLY